MLEIRRKRKAITPVIATILLIGLVALGGMAVTLIFIGTITAPRQIDIDILEVYNFQTTDNNTAIDRFSCSLKNSQSVPTLIVLDSLQLMLVDPVTGRETPLSSFWAFEIEREEIIIPAYNMIQLSISEVASPVIQLVKGDEIRLYVDAYYEGDGPSSGKTFKSTLLTVGDTFGPIVTSSSMSGFVLTESTSLTVNIVTTNLGSSDLSLYLNIGSSSPQSMFFNKDSVNISKIDFALSGDTTQYLNFTIFPTESIDAGNHFLYLSIVDKLSSKVMSFFILDFTYE